jgi:hypothetical protein
VAADQEEDPEHETNGSAEYAKEDPKKSASCPRVKKSSGFQVALPKIVPTSPPSLRR